MVIDGRFGDPELLSYVVEVDLEDTVARVILEAAKTYQAAVGDKRPIPKGRLVKVLRGVEPSWVRKHAEELIPFWGRLAQFSADQLDDMIMSLVRLGLVLLDLVESGDWFKLRLSPSGLLRLGKSEPIPMQIPWPLSAKDFPSA